MSLEFWQVIPLSLCGGAVLILVGPFLLIGLLTGMNPFKQTPREPIIPRYVWSQNKALFIKACNEAGLTPCEQRVFSRYFEGGHESTYAVLVEELSNWKDGYGPTSTNGCAEEEAAILAAKQTTSTLETAQTILNNQEFQRVIRKYQRKERASYKVALYRDRKKNIAPDPSMFIEDKHWLPDIDTNVNFTDLLKVGVYVPGFWGRGEKPGQYALYLGLQLTLSPNGQVSVAAGGGNDFYEFDSLEEFLQDFESYLDDGTTPEYISTQ